MPTDTVYADGIERGERYLSCQRFQHRLQPLYRLSPVAMEAETTADNQARPVSEETELAMSSQAGVSSV